MSCASQQHTLLWSLELYALGFLPVWAVWVLLLWWLSTVGSLVCITSPLSGWLPVLVFCEAAVCWQPDSSLGVLGLVLAHWWAELGSKVGGCGVRGPGYSFGLLLGGTSC